VEDARRGRLIISRGPHRPEAIIADYRAAYFSAMGVIERDLDALLAHLP
jgi:hypothetical protein